MNLRSFAAVLLILVSNQPIRAQYISRGVIGPWSLQGFDAKRVSFNARFGLNGFEDGRLQLTAQVNSGGNPMLKYLSFSSDGSNIQPATSASVTQVKDSAGNAFFLAPSVLKLSPSGVPSTIATNLACAPNPNVFPFGVLQVLPVRLILDASDRLYGYSPFCSFLFRYDQSTAQWSSVFDAGSNISALHLTPANIYVGVRGRIFQLDAATLTPQVIAGSGIDGDSGDGGPATQAQISAVTGIGTTPNGDLYFMAPFKVRRIVGGTISTFRNVVFTSTNPNTQLLSDPAGNVYFVDSGALYRINALDSQIVRIAGLPISGRYLEGVSSTASAITPTNYAANLRGDLVFTESGEILRHSRDTGTLTKLSGSPAAPAGPLAGVLGLEQRFNTALDEDSARNLFVNGATDLFKLTPAGSPTNVNVSCFNAANTFRVTPAGNIVFATRTAVYSLVPGTGQCTLIAGTEGQSGLVNAQGAAARFEQIRGISLSPSGDLIYVNDSRAIRAITTAGVVTTLIGGGSTQLSNAQDVSPTSLSISLSQGPCTMPNGDLVFSNNGILGYLRNGLVSMLRVYLPGTESERTNLSTLQIPSYDIIDYLTCNPNGDTYYYDRRYFFSQAFSFGGRMMQLSFDQSPPFGFFDSPANNATDLTGQISVTGWALDDVAVERVEIWRLPVPGEQGDMIFIGTALFTTDTRTDIPLVHPDKPLNRRAGWGYPLLSRGMPNNGNGTFTLIAIAFDFAGRSTELGRKTVSFSNDSRVQPIGTIDTPSVGGFVSSSTYINEGWVLTPNPHNMAGNCSGITLLLDGVEKADPKCIYGNTRPDVAQYFPPSTYSNVPNVGVKFHLDTTQIPNGLHQIAWIAKDSVNRQDGIGSRFFIVANPESTTTPAPSDPKPTTMRLASIVDGVCAKQGFDAPCLPITPSADGTYIINAKLDQKLELHFAQPMTRGTLQVTNEAAPLPAGSSLDEQGNFHWYITGSYYGPFPLTFEGGTTTRILVNVR